MHGMACPLKPENCRFIIEQRGLGLCCKFVGTFPRLYSHVLALSHLLTDSPTHAPPPAGPPRPPQATADRPLPWTRQSTGRYLYESRRTSNTVASTLVRRTMERRRGGHSSARGHHPVQSRPAPLSSAATDLPALLVRPQINLPQLRIALKLRKLTLEPCQ